MPIDLRSDTVTRPTAGMREAMARAEVDDDVIDSDPTVDRLQKKIAEMLGMEAALFMPSGTMTNQIALRLHCRPGDEFLCEAGCHIYNYEQGAFAQLSGLVARPVQGDYGVLKPEQLTGLIRPDNEHQVRTRLVCLENTHNRGAGRVLPYNDVAAICAWAKQQGLARHLDGARLFNAVVATGMAPADWAKHFDTASVCFSKGLGAPVGSALCGSKELMKVARRHRKIFGGGMRQAGIIAAGALYALQHHIPRLADDHENAQLLADAVADVPGLRLDPERIDTNIVIFRVDPARLSAAELVARLERNEVRMLAFSATHVRAVTHMDVTEAEVRQAGDVLKKVMKASAQSKLDA